MIAPARWAAYHVLRAVNERRADLPQALAHTRASLRDARDRALAGEIATGTLRRQGTLDYLAKDPSVCRHLEMETYTWEVLPDNLRSGDVVDQIIREYEWTLDELGKRGLKTT